MYLIVCARSLLVAQRAESQGNLKILAESKDAYTRTIEETELVCECFSGDTEM